MSKHFSGRKRAPRIKGICADADTLGVTRQHLYEVLKGRRASKVLSRRYRELQRSKQRAAA